MNSGAFAPAVLVNDRAPNDHALELARVQGIQSERQRQLRVYHVVLASLRVVEDEVRALGRRIPNAEDQQVAERIASTIDGAMQSMRDMKPRAA